MSPIEIYLVVVVHLGLLPAVGFPVFYSRSPWRHDVGKALMLKGCALAALFVVTVLGYWWPIPGFIYVNAAVVTLVVTGITYQFAVMRRLQREGKHDLKS